MDSFISNSGIWPLVSGIFCIVLGCYQIIVKGKRVATEESDKSGDFSSRTYFRWSGYRLIAVGFWYSVIGYIHFIGLIDEPVMIIIFVLAALLPIPYLLIAHLKFAQRQQDC
jgi:hypothetical protein